MDGYTTGAQVPPDAKRITDTVVMRHDHVYEVDPALMTYAVRLAAAQYREESPTASVASSATL